MDALIKDGVEFEEVLLLKTEKETNDGWDASVNLNY
jgi:hypothetical protein